MKNNVPMVLCLLTLPFLFANSKNGDGVPPPSETVSLILNVMPDGKGHIDLSPGPYKIGGKVEATGIITDERYYFDKWYIAGLSSYMDSIHNPIVVELDTTRMYINLILREK